MSTSLRSWALLSALALVTFVTTCASAVNVNLLINGYVQGRFTETFDDGATPSTFEARRAYLNFRACIDEHYAANILFSGFGPERILEAYGEYTDKPYSGRLGLSRIPYGYEIPLSSAGLITLERSQVMQTQMYNLTFESGIFGYYLPGAGLNVALAAVNGQPTGTVTTLNPGPAFPSDPDSIVTRATSTDINDNKVLTGRVSYCSPQGTTIGASFYTGNGPQPGSAYLYNVVNNVPGPGFLPTDDLERYGLDFEGNYCNFRVVSEYLQGSNDDVDVNGGYVTLAYQPAGCQWQPYFRYDNFDPNTDAGNDYFSRETVGVNYFPNKLTRATVEYQTVDDKRRPALDGQIAAQLQVAF